MDQAFVDELMAHANVGMVSAFWAKQKPDKVAIYDTLGARTFQELNANANRLARVFHEAGLKPGDGVALFCTNRAEFVETINATRRSGLRVTPVNWHLAAGEIAYILNDCDAKALVAETRFESILRAQKEAPNLALKLSVGGKAEGFLSYAQALATQDDTDLEDPRLGSQMLYTSGTTGRPKGVFRPKGLPTPPQFEGSNAKYDPDTDVQLCVGPAYHAAPLAF
ncbi:MAG: AMP-binding protein, partial [Alphaproteobacteria bacterium]|nr:AMP-binding protein [Alphaproteobacteria bacterium]